MTDAPSSSRRIGPHLPLAGGLLRAADRAHEIGATAVQIFTDNPTSWRRRAELPDELVEFRRRLARDGIGPIAIHAPYLVNLCGADAAFWQLSIETMVREMEVGVAYGARFVNVHTGSHRGHGRDQGIRQLARAVRTIVDAAGGDAPTLVLENSPGSGDGIGSSLEDLADIIDAAAAEGVAAERLGFCLDSAHLWAAGRRIDGDDGVAALVRRVDELVGRSRIVMLHLNDAQTACGSRIDRHQHIGGGTIGAAGLAALLRHPWLATLPTYLETPGMDAGYDAVNLQRALRLADGAPLDALPADALTPRGRRSQAISGGRRGQPPTPGVE